MERTERDSTQDWLLPAGSAPPLLRELELRVDEAVVIARASEEAVRKVGDAALDAARQARRAAELAERASEVALEASRDTRSGTVEEAGLRDFSERADRVSARLRALQRRPAPSGSASAGAARRRS